MGVSVIRKVFDHRQLGLVGSGCHGSTILKEPIHDDRRGYQAVKAFDTAAIRNVAVVGHSGSGKTSLGEALLYTSGTSTRLGKVQDGSSVLAHTTDEVKRQISIYLSLAQFEYRDRKINLIDCPGYADFVGEVYAGLHAADTALIVVNGVAGVESDTEKHLDLVQQAGKPALIVVNMMDKDEANFAKAVESIRALTNRAVPVGLPIGSASGFEGIVEVLKEKATLGESKSPKEGTVPSELSGAVEEAKNQLVELAAESDDTLLEKYLDTGELSAEEVREGFRKGISAGKIFPIFAASADRNIGISVLLDAIADLAPSPMDVPGPLGIRPGAEEEAPVRGGVSDPLAAHVFKVSSEILPQDVYLIRVYSGQIEKGAETYNSRRDQSERVSQLYHFCGKERTETDKLVAGTSEPPST